MARSQSAIDPLQISTEGPILVLTINRPAARNAITLEVAEKIEACMADLDSTSELQVAVITGAGESFCAGMDLKDFARGIRPSTPEGGFAGFVEKPPRKPIIAAVEGHALAGGFEITLACDLLVASTTACFGLPEVKRGLIAGAGGLLRLPRMLPHRIAVELALTGASMSAQRGFELGIVNRLTEPGRALAEALVLGRQIAAGGPLALQATKRILTEGRDWTVSEEFARQREITAPVFASADAREGAIAFAEKRTPKWIGK